MDRRQFSTGLSAVAGLLAVAPCLSRSLRSDYEYRLASIRQTVDRLANGRHGFGPYALHDLQTACDYMSDPKACHPAMQTMTIECYDALFRAEHALQEQGFEHTVIREAFAQMARDIDA